MSGHLAGVVVYKMTGSGNDFVFVDGRFHPESMWTPETVQAACDRRMGVGADGLVVLEPGSGAGRVRFHFFNSDGSRAGMCGNAALCATRLAAWLELASAAGMVLETDSGEVRTRCLDDGPDRAELSLQAITRLDEPGIALEEGELGIVQSVVGVDHLVVHVEDVDRVPIERRGAALRRHPAVGPAGINVNFVSRSADGWAMRTWERGVEGETLACGTGAVACGLYLARQGLIDFPWTVRSRSGRLLTASGTLQNGPVILADPRLAGEGRLVFRAILEHVGR